VGLATPVAYSAYPLLAKTVADRYHPLTILTYGFGFGALTLLPLQLFVSQPWPVPGVTWLWFGLLVGFSTIVPFALFTFALGRLPASVAGILAMAEIPVAALYAYVLLDERLSVTQILGALSVVCGVLVLYLGGRGRQE
jgi:drug/metabolite transporter (DMT)-like permease